MNQNEKSCFTCSRCRQPEKLLCTQHNRQVDREECCENWQGWDENFSRMLRRNGYEVTKRPETRDREEQNRRETAEAAILMFAGFLIGLLAGCMIWA